MLASSAAGNHEHAEHRFASLFMARNSLAAIKPGFDPLVPADEQDSRIRIIREALETSATPPPDGCRDWAINLLENKNRKGQARVMAEALSLVGIIPEGDVWDLANKLTQLRGSLSHDGVIPHVEQDDKVQEVVWFADLMEWLARAATLIRLGVDRDDMSARLRDNARFREVWTELLRLSSVTCQLPPRSTDPQSTSGFVLKQPSGVSYACAADPTS